MPRPTVRPGNRNRARPDPMDVVLAIPNEKQKLKSDIAKANNKYKNNPDKKDKRSKIEKDLIKDGHKKQDIDNLTVEMYDELSAFGMLVPRNAD